MRHFPKLDHRVEAQIVTDGMGRLFWGIGDGKGAYLVAKGWSTGVVTLD